jgi:hypothetical protein
LGAPHGNERRMDQQAYGARDHRLDDRRVRGTA